MWIDTKFLIVDICVMETAAQIAKYIVESRRLTAKELAEMLGTSQSTVSRIINGAVDPRSNTYRRLVEIQQQVKAA